VKYLCLVYHDEAALNALPEPALDALCSQFLAYRDDLQASGHLLALNLLGAVQTATTVRVRNGRLAISDGPFAETDEQLGAFVLIEARDLNEAIRLAAKLPPARLGSVEVRPVRDLDCGPECAEARYEGAGWR
jgi:hypothetical protein